MKTGLQCPGHHTLTSEQVIKHTKLIPANSLQPHLQIRSHVSGGRASYSVAAKYLRSHARVLRGGGGGGGFVDWRWHELLSSSPTERERAAHAGLSPLRHNPVYLPNNLICRTQPEFKLRYTGHNYYHQAPVCFGICGSDALRGVEELQMTQFLKNQTVPPLLTTGSTVLPA